MDGADKPETAEFREQRIQRSRSASLLHRSRSRSRGRTTGHWQPLGGRNSVGGGRREAKPEGCRTIWIGWFDERPRDEDLAEFFSDCGRVTEVCVSDHQVRGYFAHVQFEDTACVNIAMKKEGADYANRRIQLDYAYMDKVMTKPQLEANAPGRILRCKPKSVKPQNGHTLWLGDLSIDTTEQDVIDLFEPCGRIEMICLKVNQLRNGHFGHVKFYETEAVDKATQLAGTLLKGVPLRMDFAEDKPVSAYRHSKDQPVPESSRSEDCRTIFVGGLPGDVSEEMMHSLFEPCGEIREVRLDRSKRSGAQFCHVEFFEGSAVDRATRLTGERLGNSKIRVDFAENRKHETSTTRQLMPSAMGYSPSGVPPGGCLGPPPAAWLGPGLGPRQGQNTSDWPRAPFGGEWLGSCQGPPLPGPPHWPGCWPPPPPPGYPAWPASGFYGMPPALVRPLGPSCGRPVGCMPNYQYSSRPVGPEGSQWQQATTPGYSMPITTAQDAWGPGVQPGDIGRSCSCESSYTDSYSYSYSYTHSPSHSPDHR